MNYFLGIDGRAGVLAADFEDAPSGARNGGREPPNQRRDGRR